MDTKLFPPTGERRTHDLTYAKKPARGILASPILLTILRDIRIDNFYLKKFLAGNVLYRDQ